MVVDRNAVAIDPFFGDQFIEQRAGRAAGEVYHLDLLAQPREDARDVDPAAARIVTFARRANLVGGEQGVRLAGAVDRGVEREGGDAVHGGLSCCGVGESAPCHVRRPAGTGPRTGAELKHTPPQELKGMRNISLWSGPAWSGVLSLRSGAAASYSLERRLVS